MNDEVKTWHYGLIARWWGEFNTAREEELSFFRSAIERYGEPALDLGCGAGRLLIPLRRGGLDVDGCDISADMLARCERLAEREGISVDLMPQAMHELSLKRRYRTILICDSFGIGGSRADDQEALRRIHDHLLPGGVLVFNNYLPYGNPDLWALWPVEKRRSLPLPWPESGMRKTAEDGDDMEIATRIFDLDPGEQQLDLEIRARLWRDGRVVEEETRTLRENLYFGPELRMMLGSAGFNDVLELAAYGWERAGPNDGNVVFIARKRVDDA